MISTVASHAAAIHFKASLGATDSLISTSEKIDQVRIKKYFLGKKI